MSNWHVDGGLARLIAQVDARIAGNQIVGTIGDRAHQLRVSKHNPEADGSVDAADFMLGLHFTKADAIWLVNTLVKHKDPRLNGVIHNRKQYFRSHDFQPVAYNGSNPHTIEVHVEVNDLHRERADDWKLVDAPVLRRGDKGADVRFIQKALKIPADGDFGPKTEAAVKAFQRLHHLSADGIVGPNTWKLIPRAGNR